MSLLLKGKSKGYHPDKEGGLTIEIPVLLKSMIFAVSKAEQVGEASRRSLWGRKL